MTNNNYSYTHNPRGNSPKNFTFSSESFSQDSGRGRRSPLNLSEALRNTTLQFDYQEEERGVLHVLKLSGVCNSPAAKYLAAALQKAASNWERIIVADLENVLLIDSKCLGILLRAQKEANSRNSRIVIASPNERIRRALETMKLDNILEVYPDMKSVEAVYS